MAIDLYSKNLTTQEISEIHKLAGPILIFGASGFIGTNLFLTLSQCRDDIFGCSRNIKSNQKYAGCSQRSLINIDVTEYKNLSDLILEIRPKTVFNLSSYGGHSHQTDIDKIHRVNYIGTSNLIRALSDIDCGAFIQTGSSSEYGLNGTAPDENSELEPNSDYAVSKIGASYLVKYHG
ncbi:MAG: NAD-dependent epimerase/dehydratase family protein, partial [Candidatus Taylorbacteria bacterium]|nr:NAD-dependent epimerase/dehydratase family protein [Candidatus Taylorbacteria bacterium]